MNKLPKDLSIYSVAPSISNLEPLTLPLAFTTPATSNLPNEPVLVTEPLITLLAPVVIILPVAVTFPKVTLPVPSNKAPLASAVVTLVEN